MQNRLFNLFNFNHQKTKSIILKCLNIPKYPPSSGRFISSRNGLVSAGGLSYLVTAYPAAFFFLLFYTEKNLSCLKLPNVFEEHERKKYQSKLLVLVSWACPRPHVFPCGPASFMQSRLIVTLPEPSRSALLSSPAPIGSAQGQFLSPCKHPARPRPTPH